MFVGLTVAKLAQKKGFIVQHCTSRFFNGKLIYGISEAIMGIPAPLQSELQKWLREKHGLDICIVPNLLGYTFNLSRKFPFQTIIVQGKINIFQTYEEALEEGLKQLLNKLEDE